MPNGNLKEFNQSFFHGTKADLKPGDSITGGFDSNFVDGTQSRYAYFTSNLSAAIWGAELAVGDGQPRIFVVEVSGSIEDDPNLTNKKCPGNPTNSFRSKEPLSIVGEVNNWVGHTPAEIQARQDAIAKLLQRGAEIIED